ncbi:hypothetical protein C8J57DRAFT_1526510 [Mycena rebaudengoi]|nr:hypothetical protein C8J57DRAFT_1526510 [Mycena rebaudengoi]
MLELLRCALLPDAADGADDTDATRYGGAGEPALVIPSSPPTVFASELAVGASSLDGPWTQQTTLPDPSRRDADARMPMPIEATDDIVRVPIDEIRVPTTTRQHPTSSSSLRRPEFFVPITPEPLVPHPQRTAAAVAAGATTPCPRHCAPWLSTKEWARAAARLMRRALRWRGGKADADADVECGKADVDVERKGRREPRECAVGVSHGENGFRFGVSPGGGSGRLLVSLENETGCAGRAQG